MNQGGQSGSVFNLAVFAIVALALIVLIASFFPQAENNAIQELRESISLAQSTPGTGISKNIFLEKNFAVDAQKVFDTGTRSVSFQCNAMECTQKKLNVDARKISAAENISIQYTSRCIFEKSLFNCKIYFGTAPAQLKISETRLKENFDLPKEKVELEFFAENTGGQNAVDASVQVKVFKKQTVNGRVVENLYTSVLEKKIELLAPKQKLEQRFELQIKDTGDYSVEISLSGTDAGHVSEKIDFFAVGEIVSFCRIGETLETFLNETLGKCITRHSCTECSFAEECAQKWQTLLPDAEFQASTKETALEIKEPVNGACE